MAKSKTLLFLVPQVVAEEGLNLLQTHARSKSSSGLETEPVNWDHAGIGGKCATTRFVPQEVLDTVLKSSADKLEFCHCWGDTHCSHVPFDNQEWAKHGNDNSNIKGNGGINAHHYQYHHGCVSTFAKSADGNPGGPGGRWEIQINQMVQPGAVATIWGTAVKVGGITVEVWDYIMGQYMYVNDESIDRNTLNQQAKPVSLPNGLHYWNDGSVFCVLQEGQFLFRQAKDQVALLVPKKVKTQGKGTMCYDKSSMDGDLWRPGMPQYGKLITNAQVEQPGFMHQADQFERIRTHAHWKNYYATSMQQCEQMTEPDATDSPPSDPEKICEESGFPLTQAEESCKVLKEDHPEFYQDCLIDECAFGENPPEDEVDLIQEVIAADEAVEVAALSEKDACDALPTFTIKEPSYSNLAGQGPDSDGPKGILYPDAAVIDGESVDVLVTSKKFKSFDANKNGMVGGMVSLNMKCGKSATVTITIVDKNKAPVVVPAASVTVLDLDEGKGGKARTTVSSCGALSAAAGPELTSADVPGEASCKVYSSSTHGSAANNPQSLNAITDDHKKRAVTFLYGQGSSFEFDVAIGKSSKGRNLAFSLSPVLACEEPSEESTTETSTTEEPSPSS